MIEINCNLIFEFLLKVDKDFSPSLSSHLNLKDYAEKIASKALLFVDFEGSTLSGLCAVYATDKVNYQAYLTMLAVDPSYRGLGIAKKLISEMEAELSRRCFHTIKLEVYKSNYNAFSMYTSQGYKITEETDTSYFLQKNISK